MLAGLADVGGWAILAGFASVGLFLWIFLCPECQILRVTQERSATTSNQPEPTTGVDKDRTAASCTSVQLTVLHQPVILQLTAAPHRAFVGPIQSTAAAERRDRLPILGSPAFSALGSLLIENRTSDEDVSPEH